MSELLQLPRQSRAVELRAQSFDEKSMTVDVVWTTGARGRRVTWRDGAYDEELVVTPEAVRLDRLNAGAPFLNTHQDWELRDIIGTVVPNSAKIVKGEGLATIQLSRREECAGYVQDIKDGVIRNISVGYVYHQIEKREGQEGDVPLWLVTDWEPLELSAVPIPFDVGAQVRSGKEQHRSAGTFPCTVTQQRRVSRSIARRMRMAAAAAPLLSR